MVERVMYADTPGKTWAAGTAAAGVHELSSTWFFAKARRARSSTRSS